jgi:hypothetical protein
MVVYIMAGCDLVFQFVCDERKMGDPMISIPDRMLALGKVSDIICFGVKRSMVTRSRSHVHPYLFPVITPQNITKRWMSFCGFKDHHNAIYARKVWIC